MAIKNTQPKIYEKRLLTTDFIKSTEILEETINLNSNTVNNIKIFDQGININYASSLTAGDYLTWRRGNELSTVSNTSFFESVKSYFQQDADYGVPNSIINAQGLSSDFVRAISIPQQFYYDRIKPGSFSFSLKPLDDKYDFPKFLKINNSYSFDNSFNSSFVALADENIQSDLKMNDIVKKIGANNDSVGMEICFKFRHDEAALQNDNISNYTQFLYYQARVINKESLTSIGKEWTYSVSAIPSNYQLSDLIDQRQQTAELPNRDQDMTFAVALKVYKSNDLNFPNEFWFQIYGNGELLTEAPAIFSTINNNSLSALSASSVTKVNLADNNWYHFIVNWTPGQFPRCYLNGVRQAIYHFSYTIPSNLAISEAVYTSTAGNMNVPTISCIGARILPLDQQITSRNLHIIQAKDYSSLNSDSINNVLDIDKTIEYEIDTSGVFNTNLCSYFGAVNIDYYLNGKIGNWNSTELLPSFNKQKTKSEIKKSLTFDNIQQMAVNGFSGDIAFCYLWFAKIPDVITGPFATGFEICENVNMYLLGDFNKFNLQVYQRYVQGKNITPFWDNFPNTYRNFLKAGYDFWKENLDSVTVKNRSPYTSSINSTFTNVSNSQQKYDYSGAGIFINSNKYKETKKGSNLLIQNAYKIYDKPVKVFNNNSLSHGTLMYHDFSTNGDIPIGSIFYDCGQIILNTEFSYPDTYFPILDSLSANGPMSFNYNGSGPWVENINFVAQKYKYCNYVNVGIDSNECNISDNESNPQNQNWVYPTTIAFYNDNDECLATAKINEITRKNSSFNLQYKVKLEY